MLEHKEKYADLFTTEYFWLARKMLFVIGQWPYMSARRKYIFRFVILGALLNGIPFVVINIFHFLHLRRPKMNEFIHLWNEDRKRMAHLVGPLLTLCMSLIKFFNFSINQTSVLTLLSRTYNNWNIAMGEEQTILVNYGEYAKTTSKLYASTRIDKLQLATKNNNLHIPVETFELIYSAMTVFLIIPLAPAIADFIKPLNETRPRHLVFPVNYGEGIEPEDYYALMMLHAYVGCFAAITMIIASDIFFINLVIHACCLFAIAKHRLEHIYDGIPALPIHLLDLNENNCSHHPKLTELCIKRIAYAVSWHNKALNYSALVQSTFTTSLFMILGMNMVVISFTGFQILTQKDRWDDILIGLSYISGQLCHLYLLSLPGQLLVDESESIRSSIAKSYSYDIPVKAQKMLVTVLMRGLRPSKITAGKFFVLEMETFMSVLQASVSYFTVLANFS